MNERIITKYWTQAPERFAALLRSPGQFSPSSQPSSQAPNKYSKFVYQSATCLGYTSSL